MKKAIALRDHMIECVNEKIKSNLEEMTALRDQPIYDRDKLKHYDKIDNLRYKNFRLEGCIKDILELPLPNLNVGFFDRRILRKGYRQELEDFKMILMAEGVTF